MEVSVRKIIIMKEGGVKYRILSVLPSPTGLVFTLCWPKPTSAWVSFRRL